MVVFVIKEDKNNCYGYNGYYLKMGEKLLFFSSKIELSKDYIAMMMGQDKFELTKNKEEALSFINKNNIKYMNAA